MKESLIAKVFILLVVLGLAVSCAPTPTPEPTATPKPETVEMTVTKLEDMVGVWQGSDMGALQFNADGSVLLCESLEGLPDLCSHGECRFEGAELVFADADGSGEGSYSVQLKTHADKPVSLSFSAVTDPFADRRAILTQRVWHWIEP